MLTTRRKATFRWLRKCLIFTGSRGGTRLLTRPSSPARVGVRSLCFKGACGTRPRVPARPAGAANAPSSVAFSRAGQRPPPERGHLPVPPHPFDGSGVQLLSERKAALVGGLLSASKLAPGEGLGSLRALEASLASESARCVSRAPAGPGPGSLRVPPALRTLPLRSRSRGRDSALPLGFKSLPAGIPLQIALCRKADWLPGRDLNQALRRAQARSPPRGSAAPLGRLPSAGCNSLPSRRQPPERGYLPVPSHPFDGSGVQLLSERKAALVGGLLSAS